ncbi:MAG: hypothetical protein O7J95_15560 [Planctomycetota bacterium]|nr:hypothetical protein [Planctomycetota bacterium]
MKRSTETTDRRPRRSGLSLTEVTLSIGVLLVAANLLVIALGRLRADHAVRDREEALRLVKAQIEDVLAWPEYATLVSQFDGRVFAVGALRGTGSRPGRPGLVIVDDSDPDLLRVTVKAEWIGSSGEQVLELSTYVARPEATVTWPR